MILGTAPFIQICVSMLAHAAAVCDVGVMAHMSHVTALPLDDACDDASAGKAPLQDEDVEASAAEAAVAAASAAAGTSAGAMQRAAQLRQRIGNWLHPEAAKSPLPRDVPSWRWTPIFHPSVTIAGAQPAVMLPQARLCTCCGSLAVALC